MNRRLSWLLIPVAATALLVSACGGNGEADPPAGDTTAPASTEATAAAPTGGDGASTGSGGGDTDMVNLASLAGRIAAATFSATYVLNGTATDGEVMDGTWVWTQDGSSNRSRFDIEAEGESVVMIMTDEGMVVCSDGTCFSMAQAGGMFPNMGEMLADEVDSIQQDAATAEVTAASSRTIAGVEAECYDFRDTADGSAGTICYSPEGVPLLIDATSAEGNFNMEATSYSTSVSDADFEAPFPVTAFPGMGN